MSLGLFILRLVVGLLIMGHGAQKLFGFAGGGGLEQTSAQFHSLGLRPGRRNALLAGLGEFCGGLLLVLGWFTPIGSAILIAIMVTAIWLVHGRNGLWNQGGGFEFHLVLIAAAMALAGAGAGKWSLDHALAFKDTGAVWAAGALVVGLLAGTGAVIVGREHEPESSEGQAERHEGRHERHEGRPPHATPA